MIVVPNRSIKYHRCMYVFPYLHNKNELLLIIQIDTIRRGVIDMFVVCTQLIYLQYLCTIKVSV